MPNPGLTDAEIKRRLAVYDKCDRNQSEAARRLNMNRQVFRETLELAEARGLIRPDDTEAMQAALKKRPGTLQELADRAKMTPGRALDALNALRERGVNAHELSGIWSIERTTPQRNGEPFVYRSRAGGKYKFGFVSDTHLCSKYARMDVLNELYDLFQREAVDCVFHAGNWVDGEAHFNRHDLIAHGMDAQLAYLAKHYPQRDGITTYAVAGDDHEGWWAQREGVDIGRYAENKMRDAGRADWVDLGYMECFVPLEHRGTKARAQLLVMHPGGGSAYATSYAIQKIVESFEGGEKPAVLIAGHYHKMEALNCRNVWCIQPGCTQDQTPFARKKKLEFAIGGGICEMEQDAGGAIVDFAVRFRRFFNRGYTNNRWSHAGDVKHARRTAA